MTLIRRMLAMLLVASPVLAAPAPPTHLGGHLQIVELAGQRAR